MCRSGAPCGCGAGGGLPVGLWVAVVALAALVCSAASLIGTVLVVALAGVLVAGLGLVGYAVWRVRVLTRPGRPVASGQAVTAVRVRALAGRAPLALEAPRERVTAAADRERMAR